MTPLSSFGRTRATLSTGGHPLDVSVCVGMGFGWGGGVSQACTLAVSEVASFLLV